MKRLTSFLNPGARGGKIIDENLVPVPKQRNSREENIEIKAGGTRMVEMRIHIACSRRT